ncbi:uncharacterized protein LOC144906494 [Branchiostoma floridae x Branchiostoma belcheri]
MASRLFLLLALASLLTVSYGLDCLVCTNALNSVNCESNPSSFNATTCPSGLDSFCTVQKVSTGGSTTTFARACAAAETLPGCVTALTITTCNTYCNTNGCNSGDGSGAGTARASALFLVVSAILAALLH